MAIRLKKPIVHAMVLAAVLILLASCGDPQPRQETEPVRQDTEEKREPSMAEVIVDQAGEDVFYDGENSFSEEDWAKMKSLTDNIVELREKSEDNTVNRDELREVFQEHDIESIEQGSQLIREYAELQDLLISLAMRSNALQTERMMGDDEGIKSVTKEIKETLTSRKITKDDLLAIDDNLDVIGQAVAVQFIVRSAQ